MSPKPSGSPKREREARRARGGESLQAESHVEDGSVVELDVAFTDEGLRALDAVHAHRRAADGAKTDVVTVRLHDQLHA